MTTDTFIDEAIRDYGPAVLSFAGVAAIPYLDIYSVESSIVFWIATVMIAVGTVLAVRNGHRCSRLARKMEALEEMLENSRTSYYDHWDDTAREIYHALNLTDRQRLSIYKYDDDIQKFRLLGRFSDNHAYRRRGRPTYPPDQGIIGAAWASGEAFERALPNPKSHSERYHAECERRYHMPRDVSASLTMKAVCLWAYALRNSLTNVRFAIVVIESTKRDDLDGKALKAAFENRFADEIAKRLVSLQKIEPSMSDAARLGF